MYNPTYTKTKSDDGKICYLHFFTAPFRVTFTQREVKPGCWNYQDVLIYRRDPDRYTEIGGYTYRYSSGTPFYPFQGIDGRWYALYSEHYTATRVALLEPEFQDWCGEEPSGNGFCPVQYYVPRHKEYSWEFSFDKRGGEQVEPYKETCHASAWDNNTDWDKSGKEIVGDVPTTYVGESNLDYGFVAGCVWGDDSSWKIEHLDLSGIPEKKIERSYKYGRILLPVYMDLPQAIRMEGNRDEGISLNITHEQWWDKEDKELASY